MDNKGLEPHHGVFRELFYQSVAETLTLLHAAPGYDRRQALLEVARTLASIMDLPLVWIGRRELAQSRLDILAAGLKAAYASSLRISDDPHEPGGRGPAGMVLRDGRARLAEMDSGEYAPALDGAREHGFGSVIVAAAGTADGGQLMLAVYSWERGPALTPELLDWAQRLADELARFWDDQALFERNLRLSRYRDAHRVIQRAMLRQLEPEAIYLTLAETLVDVADAAACIVYVPEGGILRRIVRVGEVADAIGSLPEPPVHAEGASVRTPTQTFMQGVPTVRLQPSTHPDVSPEWRVDPLTRMGAMGCWPIFSSVAVDDATKRTPDAVLLLATPEMEAFDADLRQLLDEITDTVGLALRQHRHREALFQEQDRQTYLASHDALTDLPNRRALDGHLERALIRAARHQRMVAVGMLDLDDLKPINDRYGHAAGDRVLIELAARLNGALRSEDYVARLGGDEFVLVFDELASEADLDSLLARLGQSLQQPMPMGESNLHITVSLGIALYPNHAGANGEQLLRLADQAMYLVKARKHQRSNWWEMALSRAGAVPEEGAKVVMPHGEDAAALLRPCVAAWQPQLPALAKRFFEAVQLHKGIAGVLAGFPPYALKAFRARASRQLQTLLYPGLDLDAQRDGAIRAGTCQAACGIEEAWLVEAAGQLRDIVSSMLGTGARANRKALAIVLQRLAMEEQWQRDSMRELRHRRQDILARVSAMAWSADDYLQLVEGAVNVLAVHDEVVACAAGRPDASGRMVHEIVAGAVAVEPWRGGGNGQAPSAQAGPAAVGEHETSGRAWRTTEIQRCEHDGADPAMVLWRDAAMRHGVVSHVAIPLCLPARKPLAILTLYSHYAGGFHSESQQAFVEQIRAVLELALLRMAPQRQLAALLPAFVRQRWRSMITTGALRMYYQPMIRLADRHVVGFEALARLRDELGSMLLPASFLPALGAAGLMRLFRNGIIQAVACRQSLARNGLVMGMSVNVPTVAVRDSRYAQTVETVLQASGCPVGALRFEALESLAGQGCWALMASAGVQSLKSLDGPLIEDEPVVSRRLLARLSQSPFDRIKIDQAMIFQVRQDPLGALRLIRQLIRVGHAMNQEVVVEGLESPGMLEAAAVLGADFGQGFALARPMPPEALPDWLAGFDASHPDAFPASALGALAGALRWEERFVELSDEPHACERHVQAGSIVGDYLRHAEGVSDALRASHEAMRGAAGAGPFDHAYGLRRDALLALLVERALDEERRFERMDQDAA
ncbi:MAG: diguanylate cyclase [Xanthomonadaceae bacterium]|nr:diguanylate cyclase [Xanthomonadaceae bacterium]